MLTVIPRRQGWVTLRAFVLIACVFLSTALLATFFFLHNRALTQQQLRTTLQSFVAVSAMQFDADELSAIRDERDMRTPVFRNTVQRLNQINQNLPGIRYAYIMRRTDDPMKLEFVADGDLYAFPAGHDENGNGVIDPEEEPSLPGQSYDISLVPALQRDAFLRPSSDEDFTTDQWGTFISAYAPIYGSDGSVEMALGIDMNASDFLDASMSLFRPAVFLLVVLLGLFLSSYTAVLFWRRRMEMLHEFDHERSALINLALHQMGAPLAIFRWWIEILVEKSKSMQDPECTEICTQLTEGVDRMSEIVLAMQEVSAFEHAIVEKVQTPAFMNDLVRTVVKDSTKRASDKKLTFTEEYDERDVPVYLDRNLLAGIIREIIFNAIDYSFPEHGIVVRTKAMARGVEVQVEDKGCGIPKKDLPRLFTRFTRGTNASKLKPTGNGVGLFLVKQILEKAGGKIWIESEEGKGTLVSFFLPTKT